MIYIVVAQYAISEGSVTIIDGNTDTEIIDLDISDTTALYPIGAGIDISNNRIYSMYWQ